MTNIAFESRIAARTGGEREPYERDAPHADRETRATGHAPGFDLELAIHHDLESVAEEWRPFEARADCTVFQTYDWLCAWQREIGTRRGAIPLIVIGREHGDILFILPLMIERRALVRRLSWLGSDLSDYNAPLLAKDFSHRFGSERFLALWQDICWLIRGSAACRFDVVDLKKMPQTIGPQRNPFLALKLVVAPFGAHATELGKNWDAFYASKRSASTRQRERNKLKKLAEHGEICFVTPTQPEEIERTLDWLLDQKTESLARMGIASIFERPGIRQFYLDVAKRAPRLAEVNRLDIGSTIATASFGLIFRGSYHYLVASYRGGDFAKYGAGNVHLHHLLRRAIDLGLDHFDFTIGDEPYKKNWCDSEQILYEHASAVTLRGRLAVAIIGAMSRAKRIIKREPVLWNAFVKLRALAGSVRGRPRIRATGEDSAGPAAEDR
ncbi:MAG TPA: GNAT family N-acetyltransferase [Methylovirgula sp.]|nr:GNAT family N-acetyltransferase [Methylovirgula sp.]